MDEIEEMLQRYSYEELKDELRRFRYIATSIDRFDLFRKMAEILEPEKTRAELQYDIDYIERCKPLEARWLNTLEQVIVAKSKPLPRWPRPAWLKAFEGQKATVRDILVLRDMLDKIEAITQAEELLKKWKRKV